MTKSPKSENDLNDILKCCLKEEKNISWRMYWLEQWKKERQNPPLEQRTAPLTNNRQVLPEKKTTTNRITEETMATTLTTSKFLDCYLTKVLVKANINEEKMIDNQW